MTGKRLALSRLPQMPTARLDDVTLYVPARNAASWLVACIEAIGRLDPAPRAVIVVVDESSRDETVAVARGLSRVLPDVQVIAQPRPGLPAARNTAFTHAKTRWVASIDADVLVAPDWLGALWQARATLDNPAAISGRTEERIAQTGDAFRALMMPHHWGAHVMRGPFMTISDALFDRAAVLAVGGYRESLERYGDDSRLSQDLRDAGYALAYTPHARGLHIRTDTVSSVLELRWSYSEPRQRARLMDLEGLKTKLAVNIEYGRMATARALEAGEPTLAWIGALLPLHHAVADLNALLVQRTLLSQTTRRDTLAVLQAAIASAAAASSIDVACGALGWADLKPGANATTWPAFAAYVQTVVDACLAWIEEVTPLLTRAAAQELEAPHAETLARWCALLGGPAEATAPGTNWRAPRSAAPWRRPAQTPAQTPAASHAASASSVPVRVALDAFEHPSDALHSVVVGARAVALSYTLPARLKPGSEILLAVDLAEACAGAGLSITGFKTLAGGVEVWAERQTP